MMRRGKVHFSSITKDLLMLVLWFVVVMVVLYTDFGVQPLSILTTTTVFAAVLGFALQETLGNVFSGLSLSIGRPFNPGDWIRSGQYLGRVKGVAWRATTIITRANVRLEVPNSVIAKDALFNYATGHVCDELMIGISYGVPPNHVREVVLTLLRDVPQVLRDPPPEVLAWNYSDFAIEYRIKYSIADYGLQEHVRDRVASSLWYALRRHSIEIPFPTRTVYVRVAGRDADDKADADFERELMSGLRQVYFLRGLNDDELRLLVPTVAVRQFGAGEMLMRAGEQGDSMFIVRSGTAEVFAHTADGQTRHIGNYAGGDFTGEMALMTGEPRTASVRAIRRGGVALSNPYLPRTARPKPDAGVMENLGAVANSIRRKNTMKEAALYESHHRNHHRVAGSCRFVHRDGCPLRRHGSRRGTGRDCRPAGTGRPIAKPGFRTPGQQRAGAGSVRKRLAWHYQWSQWPARHFSRCQRAY